MTAALHAPQRVLIIRLSAIGDVVMASGLIPALREISPQACIAWLVEPAAAPLLRHNPRLDEVIVLPRDEWHSLWRARRPVARLRSGLSGPRSSCTRGAIAWAGARRARSGTMTGRLVQLPSASRLVPSLS
jgi:heptosyltransferase-1